jgi:hypothetical protein
MRSCETPVVTYDVHIRTTDGGIQYPDAFSVRVVDHGMLRVQVGEDLDHADEIFFSPGYWCQYVVDPNCDDPLALDFDDLDGFEDDEDVDDNEDLSDNE